MVTLRVWGFILAGIGAILLLMAPFAPGEDFAMMGLFALFIPGAIMTFISFYLDYMSHTRKSCPYCGEKIMADAIKCKHCGEWMIEGQTRQ